MARREAVEQNKLCINDNISGTVITLFYRMPTTIERQSYQNMSIQRQRNKVVHKQAEARLKYGSLVLTGFKTGDFEKKVKDKYVAMASDAADPLYDPDWKVWANVNAADLVMLLAAHVFDAPAEIASSEDVAGN
jgi:hypothetical protein